MSIEIISKFPKEPSFHILYYVYNSDMIESTEELIRDVHGAEYLDKYVTVLAIGEGGSKNHMVYFDPLVFKYKNSWSN